MYCFTHGLPTVHVGSWLPGSDIPQCGNHSCRDLDAIWNEMWRKGMSWLRRQDLECDTCKRERKRRCRVLKASDLDRNAKLEAFAAAPYVHPFNQPKYHALMCHAIHYAKTYGKKVYWVICLDWPLTKEEEDLDIDKLQAMRMQWLTYHDQMIGGIMVMLPLVQDMPMRMTATFLPRRGTLVQTPRLYFSRLRIGIARAG